MHVYVAVIYLLQKEILQIPLHHTYLLFFTACIQGEKSNAIHAEGMPATGADTQCVT